MKLDEVQQNIDTALYRNRWIAMVRGRVVGVGLSKAQAYRAALRQRSKEKPVLYFIDSEGKVNQCDA